MSKFTVFGAHGNTGSIVAHRLLDAGHQVRAVARDASKLETLRARGAEVVTADVTNRAQVQAALAGADAAYLLLPPDMQSNDLIARARTIVANYKAGLANVPRAVLLSSIGAQVPSGTGPIVTTHIAEQELPATVTALRAAYFMENILMNAHPMKADGVLPVFGGGETYPFPMVATRDIGAVAAELLLSPTPPPRVVELAGPADYSFVDAASSASAILGRPVRATAVPIEQLVPTFTSFGISPHVAGMFRDMILAFGKGLARFESTPRRATTPLSEVLRSGLA